MKIVVIGAGQAALQTILSLRQGGFEGAIHLVGDEAYIPYQRPPLSKAYLSGKLERERLFLKPDSFYQENNITLHLGQSVQAIDPARKTISGPDGFSLSYEKLVIATGSRPRVLNLPGRALNNIFDLRNIADIDAMAPLFQSGKRLAVIGGGYIGLEAASVARSLGVEVTVLEAAPRLLARG
jgi:3-phenylpropionate/trans-cinnamate dioxygenase ferredoxin reductase subunit